MYKIQSQLFIDQLQAQVEQQLGVAVSVLQNLDEHILQKPAPAGGWSVLQCLDHLNSYGHYYLPWLTKALHQTKGNSLWFKSGWLGNYFAKLMLPESKQKFKAFKGHQPGTQLKAYEVIAEFISQQEKLLTLLEDARSCELNKRLIPISIAPFIHLKTGDVFRFLIAHIQRHLVQAQRNLS